jgi:hypothetical protein
MWVVIDAIRSSRNPTLPGTQKACSNVNKTSLVFLLPFLQCSADRAAVAKYALAMTWVTIMRRDTWTS